MQTSDDESALDRALLRQIAAGDREAFEVFFRAHERRVYRFVVRLVHDDDIAADVVSDAMVEVWRSAARYANRAKPSTWLLGIAHHKAIDRLRRSAREIAPLRIAQKLGAGPDGHDAFGRHDEPERSALDACTRDEIDAALARLSAEHRAVLHLAFVLDYAQAEIAAITGVPLGTVKTRLFYAKRALKCALAASELQREIS